MEEDVDVLLDTPTPAEVPAVALDGFGHPEQSSADEEPAYSQSEESSPESMRTVRALAKRSGNDKLFNRWTIQEDQLIGEGVERFGFGAWSKIRSLFHGKRTTPQIKNRAQHIRRFRSADSQVTQKICDAYNQKFPANFQATQTAPDSENALPCRYNSEEISDAERIAVGQFFRGAKGQTPEKYLLIRNEIISLWLSSQPQSIKQMQCRVHLSRIVQVDVKVLGQVFNYLVSTGQINTTDPLESRDYTDADLPPDSLIYRSRRPKKRPEFLLEELATGNKQRIFREKRTFHESSGTENEDREFFLVSPEAADERKLKFTVIFDSFVKVFVDFHAHLMHTEVIGLLGGTFDAVTCVLTVAGVFPCKSVSSGFECEMDPVSELEAAVYFEEHSMQIVGWYHSHPVFEPDPSIRDIENQWNYQRLFTENQFSPFIGVIVNPFRIDRSGVETSKFRFIYISREFHPSSEYRIPLECIVSPTECEFAAELRQSLYTLYRQCSEEVEFVNLTVTIERSQITKFEKLFLSLSIHVSLDANRQFIAELIDTISHSE